MKRTKKGLYKCSKFKVGQTVRCVETCIKGIVEIIGPKQMIIVSDGRSYMVAKNTCIRG
jgi:hypothetical protein